MSIRAKVLLPAYLLLALQLNSFAQSCLQVSARSGLNIRDTPSLSGKKLVTAPFLACIDAVDDRVYDLNDTKIQSSIVEVAGMKGRWLKVEYNGIQGYAFDGLFGFFGADDEPSTTYGMFEEQAYCNTVFYPPLAFPNHYALVSDGHDHWQLSKVELDYFFSLADECVPEYTFNMKTTSPTKSEMVICSQKEWKTGPLTTYRSRDVGQTTFGEGDSKKDNIDLGAGKGILSAEMQGKRVRYLYFSNGGIKQSIDFCTDSQNDCHTDDHPEDPEDPYAYQSYIQLRWAGDLDGDGKTDLLLDGNFPDYMVLDLWLSSLAKPGELVGRGARYFYWYCC